MTGTDGRETVLRYHQRTTHRPGRSAPGPGFLDWASQPDPFRTYQGAARVELPLAGADLVASWGGLHQPGAVASRPLDRASLGAFFELALGLTAWKEYRGSRWALRANPSSGNLHPTEGYAFLADAPGVPPGVYHYVSCDHVLERRLSPSPAGVASLGQLLPRDGFLLGLTSIHWREAWKYGERAFRYCQHDVGHAVGGIRYAAAALGWSARLLKAPGDDDVSSLLGLDRAPDLAGLDPHDREHPDGLLLVAPPGEIDDGDRRIESALGALRDVVREGAWAGRPNALSADHVDWPAIAEVAAASAKPRTARGVAPTPEAPSASAIESSAGGPGETLPASALIRRRRSAVAMDGETGLTAPAFFAILDRLLPRPGVPPCDVLPWPPRVHPVLFIHRVDELDPGIYLLERDPRAHGPLRAALRSAFSWERPAGCPQGLRLFRLEKGDARSLARFASCQQEIASDSAFAVAMLGDLGPDLQQEPWWYRRLHWEVGVLGQALYLEAEVAGVRGTGIGCFFDDVVHEALGLGDERFRDLYHFTIGGPVEDRRLATLPGYAESVQRRA